MLRVSGVALLLAGLLAMLSCVRGSPSPLTTPGGSTSSSSEAALQWQVARIADAINRKDLRQLGQIPAAIFRLNSDVALRFYTHSTMSDNPNPPTNPSTFFSDFFAENDNIALGLAVDCITINGNEAEVIVEFSLSALYLLEVPPLTYQAESTDLMVFAVADGEWRLVSWQEQPPEVPDETVLLDQVAAVASALNEEDLDALLVTFSPLYRVDSDFAERFMTPSTLAEPPSPASDPSAFFGELLNNNRNLNASLSVNTYFIIGAEATVEVTFSMSALYIGELPAVNYQVEPVVDALVFELWEGQWLLKSWAEKPPPVEPTPDEAALAVQLETLAQAISEEDLGAIQAMVSGQFTMDESVALLFHTSSTQGENPNPPLGVGAFFGEVFAQNVDLTAAFSDAEVSMLGSAATVNANFVAGGTYILDLPPTAWQSEPQAQVMVFEFVDGTWYMVRWQEAQPVPPIGPQAVAQQVNALGDAINHENTSAFQALLSPLFGFNQEVQLRFQTSSTLADPPNPPAGTASFLNEVFAQNENLALTLTPNTDSIVINGNVATLSVEFSLSGTYLLTVPPTDYEVAPVTDVMVFEYADDAWTLVSWQPQAPPSE